MFLLSTYDFDLWYSHLRDFHALWFHELIFTVYQTQNSCILTLVLMIKSNITVFDEGESPYEAMDHIE